MKDRTALSFDRYVQYLSSVSEEELTEPEAYSSDALLGRINLFSSHILPFVLNYKTMLYTYIGSEARQAVGLPVEAFYEGGWEFTESVWNLRDILVFKEHIFKENLLFFQDHADNPVVYRINYNYRVQNGKGVTSHIQQQSTFLHSKDGSFPVASFGTVMDVTSFKNDSRILHRIEVLNPDGEWTSVSTKSYYPDINSEDLLSKTEIEILKWVVAGYTSPDIASKLNRSIHTIKTHRKNMFEKTNAKNVAGLLAYANNHGLL